MLGNLVVVAIRSWKGEVRGEEGEEARKIKESEQGERVGEGLSAECNS